MNLFNLGEVSNLPFNPDKIVVLLGEDDLAQRLPMDYIFAEPPVRKSFTDGITWNAFSQVTVSEALKGDFVVYVDRDGNGHVLRGNVTHNMIALNWAKKVRAKADEIMRANKVLAFNNPDGKCYELNVDTGEIINVRKKTV